MQLQLFTAILVAVVASVSLEEVPASPTDCQRAWSCQVQARAVLLDSASSEAAELLQVGSARLSASSPAVSRNFSVRVPFRPPSNDSSFESESLVQGQDRPQDTSLMQVAGASAITGQARGMLALVQGSATLDAAGEQASSSASSALLVMISVVIVAIGLYAGIVAWDAGKSNQVPLRPEPPRPVDLASKRSLPRPPGESMLSAFPPMRAAGPSPSNPALSQRQVPQRPSVTGKMDTGIPVICPVLVMPTSFTRLAVPVEPLLDPHFEFDVLGLSGVPLLSAAAIAHEGRRAIEISLHSVGTLLAVVTPNLQLTDADGSLIGSLQRQTATGASMYPPVAEEVHHVLRNRAGSSVLALTPGRTPQEMKMIPIVGNSIQSAGNDQASVTRRPPSQSLPAEHYEVVVGPNVDAVLVLSCFLALVVFALPPPSTTPMEPPYQRPATTSSTLPQARGSGLFLPA
eukprot:CAMPEP_0197652494 /NCGR_PEP_ID=MMETSP1338-20131121/34483_1 /TAXON_ID=43686 ORGANISM="Pelagodinium beii, Strain RCC1491" /NCGR_SAMPLE_ID=MMETSP1338 /ASSEMBLY_ACC=CAM_ASM_000754 /LENGTH=458 /DNA_ID=CAMNT_0043227381 /DNA_START=77 /DNA_END=1453 /DNA_ORIENTATION=+